MFFDILACRKIAMCPKIFRFLSYVFFCCIVWNLAKYFLYLQT